MSTLNSFFSICALCGEESKQTALASVSTFASPDLDGRPAEMLRSTMRYWIHECPHCGYVNRQVDDPCNIQKDALFAEYSTINASNSKPLANIFVKYAYLLKNTGASGQAVLQLLRAAWISDDENDQLGAFHWRDIAIELADECLLETGHPQWGDLLCMKADMLRRIGEYSQVLLILPPKRNPLSRIQTQLLTFQKELAEKQDHDVHRMEEITGYDGDRGSMMFGV